MYRVTMIRTYKKSLAPRMPSTIRLISSLLVADFILGISWLEPSLFMALSRRASASENPKDVSNVTSWAEKVVVVLFMMI